MMRRSPAAHNLYRDDYLYGDTVSPLMCSVRANICHSMHIDNENAGVEQKTLCAGNIISSKAYSKSNHLDCVKCPTERQLKTCTVNHMHLPVA